MTKVIDLFPQGKPCFSQYDTLSKNINTELASERHLSIETQSLKTAR